MQTPGFLLHTYRGSSPNMTWDATERTCGIVEMGGGGIVGMQLDVLQLLDQQSALASCPGGGRAFMGVPEQGFVVATPRDPCGYEYIGAVRNATDETASIVTVAGARQVSPTEYVAVARGLDADLVVSLADEVPANSKKSRIITSCKRTVEWLKRTMDERGSMGVLGNVQGGMLVDSRGVCTDNIVALIDRLEGICIGGLGTGESVQERFDIIKLVLDKIPREKVRMVSSISSPAQILEAVALGIDLFDTSYVADATKSGYALYFSIYSSNSFFKSSHHIDVEESSKNGSDGTKMNLWADWYAEDKRAILSKCGCDTCRNHTRSYIHHLLVTHEMTAQVLLEQHNVYHFMAFFDGIRRAIREKKFLEFKDAWTLEQRTWATKM